MKVIEYFLLSHAGRALDQNSLHDAPEATLETFAEVTASNGGKLRRILAGMITVLVHQAGDTGSVGWKVRRPKQAQRRDQGEAFGLVKSRR
ncbi:hypothetical protein Nm8I071_22360 [Nonomuraea sp. TT08I-71]|nr:hypothetical protein Nm8I071_22360 [Nonomuraea sp. TT08I-71]